MGELAPERGGADIPFYASEVERAGLAGLAAGDRLSFAVQTDPMRRRSFAVGLVLLEG